MANGGLDKAVEAVRQQLEEAGARVRAAEQAYAVARYEYDRLQGALNILRGAEDSRETPTSYEIDEHTLGGSLRVGTELTHVVVGDEDIVFGVRPTKSIRAIVQDFLEGDADRWFSTDEVVEHAYNVDDSGKSYPKVRHNVRSSLWSLRQKELIESSEDHRAHRARNRSNDSEPTPAGSAAGAGSDLKPQGGEHEPEAEDDLRDLRPDRQAYPVDPGRHTEVAAPG